MDPDEALREIRRAVAEYRRREESETGIEFDLALGALMETLVDSSEALDDWLSKGGFRPTAWEHKSGR